MPTIRLRSDTRKYELSYVDVDGRRYRIDTQTRDSKIARMWLKKSEELLSMAKLGMIPRVGRITREAVIGQTPSEEIARLRLSEFEQEYQERSKHDLELSAGTQELNQCAFSSFQGIIGDSFVDSITPDDVHRWKRTMDREKKSKTTISIYQRALKAAFTRAVRWKLIPENPFADVEIPSSRRGTKLRRSMGIEEVRILLGVIQDIKFRRYVQFLLYTACRRNEILYLKREDMDLEQHVLYVTVSKTHRRLALPINQALMKIIEKMIRNGEFPEEGYIFRSESNRSGSEDKPWHEDSVPHRFKDYIRLAGLPEHYTLHSCRHTFVTHLRSKGVPQDVIQRLVGHTSTQTTDIYDHADALFFRQFSDMVDYEEENDKG